MLVTTLKHAEAVFERFLRRPWAVTDTETKSRPQYKGKKDALVFGRMGMVCMSMCHKGESYAFVTSRFDPSFPTAQEYMALPSFRQLQKEVRIVFHNANYDWMVFWAEKRGFKFRKSYCTMIGGWVANSAQEKSLKSHAPLYGRHIHKTSTVDFNNLADLSKYAEEDVVATDEIYQMQQFGEVVRFPKLRHLNSKGVLVTTPNPMPSGILEVPKAELGEFEKKFYDWHEWPYFKSTFDAEVLGFPVNKKKLKVIRTKIAEERERVLKKIYRKAGQVFNLNSNPQKVEVFKKLRIAMPFVSRKTQKPSLAADALIKMQMQSPNPFISDIQYCTSVSTLARFVDPLKGLGHYIAEDGRIHASANTVGAETGRGSSSNPNLQQIPSRKDIFAIKDAFEAPKGYSLICLDHAGLELRIMALLSREARMAEALNDVTRDIHTETANDFSVDRDPTAKQINFLLQYAGTAWALAEKLTIEGMPTTVSQADVYVQLYRQTRPRVIEYRQELLREHEKEGFVTLLTGRKRGLEEHIRWNSRSDRHRAETRLSNNVVQGSGQDILKAGIIRCDWRRFNPDKRVLNSNLPEKPSFKAYLRDRARELEKHRRVFKQADMRFALQVHDEGIFFAKTEAAEEVGNRIAEILVWKHYFPAIVPYSVRLRVEGGIGQTWKEAKGKKAPIRLDKLATY